MAVEIIPRGEDPAFAYLRHVRDGITEDVSGDHHYITSGTGASFFFSFRCPGGTRMLAACPSALCDGVKE